MEWSNHKFLNNFWRSRLGNLEGHFYIHFYKFVIIFILFVSINNMGHTLMIIVDKQKKIKRCNLIVPHKHMQLQISIIKNSCKWPCHIGYLLIGWNICVSCISIFQLGAMSCLLWPKKKSDLSKAIRRIHHKFTSFMGLFQIYAKSKFIS
jgi:hypothetical protein